MPDELPFTQTFRIPASGGWSQQSDLNRRPTLYESVALPTELCWPNQANQRVMLIYLPRDSGLVTLSCHRSLLSMEIKAPGEAKGARKVVFHRVAENLYRLESSGG